MIGLVDGNNFFVSCERVFDPTLEGRPVAVLSNNDGCCVSRSNEFKALGIPMGTPYFQLKDRERTGELVFRSSNYELYGDMSRRMVSVLREEAVDVEQYSIDEAFIHPPDSAIGDLEGYGVGLRAKILKWVGIPCGIGFAPTRTLAKIANHIGKKMKSGVFVMPEDVRPILSGIPVGEVWGIGRRLSRKFMSLGILTAEQFMDMPDDDIRKAGSVLALRTALELRGIPCVSHGDLGSAPDSITCSRTFGETVTTLDDLVESIASFAATAAVRLRRHGLFACGCNIYAQIGTACDHTYAERTVVFPRPTDATNEIISSIRPAAEALFLPGARYRKSGIVFFGLQKEGTPRQMDLFAPDSGQQSGHSRLFKAVDAINAKLSGCRIATAAEGIGEKSWRIRRDSLSRRATTCWDELLAVR